MKAVSVLVSLIVVNFSSLHGMDWTGKHFHEASGRKQIDVYGHVDRSQKAVINLYNLTEVTLGSLFSPLLAIRKLFNKYSGLQEQLYYEFVLFPDDVDVELIAFN